MRDVDLGLCPLLNKLGLARVGEDSDEWGDRGAGYHCFG